MTCKKCAEFQSRGNTSYFRWGNTNIEVRACEEHLTEVFAVLRGHAAVKAREADLLAALEKAETHLGTLCPDRYNGGETLATLLLVRASIARAKGE